MKSYPIAALISTFLILNTASAIFTGSRYGRSLYDNANRYQMRDTVSDSDDDNNANKDVIDAAPTSNNAAGKMNIAPQVNEFSDDEENSNSLSQQSPAFGKLKMYASFVSVLANIARIPETIAAQIDSTISGLQKTYPVNTNVGAYLVGTQFFLRNPRALLPFDLLDRAGFGRLPDLVSSMPSIFIPIINALDRFWEAMVERFTRAMRSRFASAPRYFNNFVN